MKKVPVDSDELRWYTEHPPQKRDAEKARMKKVPVDSEELRWYTEHPPLKRDAERRG